MQIQQLQNTHQYEYLRQAFPTTRPAANLWAPSDETNSNSNSYKIQNNKYLRQAFPTTPPAANLGAPSNESNSNTQQLQNAQQHEYIWQAFPTTPPAANRVAPSNKSTNLLFFIAFVIFIFSLLFFVGTLFSK